MIKARLITFLIFFLSFLLSGLLVSLFTHDSFMEVVINAISLSFALFICDFLLDAKGNFRDLRETINGNVSEIKTNNRTPIGFNKPKDNV